MLGEISGGQPTSSRTSWRSQYQWTYADVPARVDGRWRTNCSR